MKPHEEFVKFQNLGLKNLKKKDYEQALNAFKMCLKINSQNPKSTYYIAKTLTLTERRLEANEYFDMTISKFPNFSAAFTKKGENLMKMGMYYEALTCFYNAIKISPNLSSIHIQTGIAHNKLNQHQMAIEILNVASKLNPRDAHCHILLAFSYYKLGLYTDAINSYDRAINIKVNLNEAYFKKGLILGKLGRYEEEIICYDFVIKNKPKFFSSFLLKAKALIKLKKYVDALNMYDISINKFPKYLTFYEGKHLLLEHLNKPEESLAILNLASINCGDTLKIELLKGKHFLKRGNYDNALEYFENILKNNPEDQRTLEYLEMVKNKLANPNSDSINKLELLNALDAYLGESFIEYEETSSYNYENDSSILCNFYTDLSESNNGELSDQLNLSEFSYSEIKKIPKINSISESSIVSIEYDKKNKFNDSII
jgi:tetratricopeptide (TPR) repeat protein